MKKITLLFVCFFASLAHAEFLPEDLLQNAPLQMRIHNINQQEFTAVINQLQTEFSPVVSSHGGKLSIAGDWKNDKPNAAATQMMGNWQVKTTGGLARHPDLTADGFALILCHELGHHLGGFPFAPADNPLAGVWAANEGQSDYFATQFCARRIWSKDIDKNSQFRASSSEEVRKTCDQYWSTMDDQNLCYRSLTAVSSMIQTMAKLMNKPMPQFSTPDPNIVDKTMSGHPAVQCRMDTSLQGAICTAPFDGTQIPGKKSAGGPANIEAEREAASVSCSKYLNYSSGLRPQCWFKPRL